MSAYQDIHSALNQSLIDLDLGVDIAFEGQNFDPKNIAGTIFISENFSYNQQESLSKNTLDEITGIYQLSVCQRTGLGVAPVLTIVDQIIDNYEHNAKFTSGDQTVVIINSGRGSARMIDSWYIVDISVLFKSDKLRA